MKNFFSLTKVLIKQTFRRGTNKKTSKGMIALYIILGFLLLFAAASFVITAYMLGGAAKAQALEESTLSFLFTIVQLVVLFFGIPVILNTIYFSKDNEMLLAMPFKPAAVFTAKFVMVYFIEFLTTFVMMATIIVPFAIAANIGFSVGLVFAFILVPLLPLLLATLLAIPLMYLVSFFKNKGVFASIAYILLFSIFFVVYFLFMVYMNSGASGLFSSETEINLTFTVGVSQIMLPNKFLAIACTSSFANGMLNFLYVVLINLGLLGLAVVISRFVYVRSISRQLETPKMQNSKQKEFATRGVMKSLVQKDFNEIMRFPPLAFLCFSQIVMGLIFIMVALMPSLISNNPEVDMTAFIKPFLPVGLLAVNLIVFSSNYTAFTAISRERDNFYLIKILPTRYEDVLKSKVILGSIFNELIVIISFIFGLALGANALEMLAVLIVATLLGYAYCCLQVNLDLAEPKLKWDNPSKGLKNSKVSLISIGIGVGIIIIVIVAYILLLKLAAVGVIIFWIMLALFGLGLCFVMHKTLYNNAQEKFDKIES